MTVDPHPACFCRELRGRVELLERRLNSLVAAGAGPAAAAQADASARAQRFSRVLTAIAREFGVSSAQLVSRDRSKFVSQARSAAFYVLALGGEFTLREIGNALGGRNHTRVIEGRDRVVRLLPVRAELRRRVGRVIDAADPEAHHVVGAVA